MKTTIVTYTLAIVGAVGLIWAFIEATWLLYYWKPELFR